MGATCVASLSRASLDLHEDTAGVLARVQDGEVVVITVNGKALINLAPVQPARRWLPRVGPVRRSADAPADPGLPADSSKSAGNATDDLAIIRSIISGCRTAAPSWRPGPGGPSRRTNLRPKRLFL